MEEVLHISKGDFLWLDTANHGGNGVAIGARVLSVFCDNRSPVGERRILLMDDDGKKIEVNSADLYRNFNARSMHPTSIQVVEDLLHLREPHEAAIMRNLQIRHREGINYTFIGQRILLALHPIDNKITNSFKQFNALYSSHSPLELPPHIFSIGADLLQKMGKNYLTDEDESTHSLPNNCCVVFSGECGSGKSTNTRHLLNFMAENAAGPMMDEKLKAIHLLLDAFGNAKTASNLNGTRTGKCWELHFSDQNGKAKLNSANIEHFFLEKGRIVDASIWPENQSNFHIFYSLMAGLSQKQKLEFGHSAADQAKNYHFLDRNKNVNISDPPTDLSEICSALRTLLFKETEIDSILRILSAILHLGNLRFDAISTGDGIERVEVNDRKNIGRICTILKLDESNLLCALTTKRTLLKNGESFAAAASLDVRGALDARDCIVRECYSKLVGQIVTKANGTLGGRRKEPNPSGIICLVDFPGIETNFEVENNFEQLCINYTSECLQQFFIRRIFKFEQSEYEAQGLPGWAFGSIGFSDNWPILDMLAVNSLSLMAVIDDTSCAPNATDDEALERLHNAQQKNGQRFFLSPKSRLCAQFVVCHYTGQVAYRVKGMLAKNRNQFAHQLRLLFLGSQLKFVQRLFELPTQNGGNEWITENEGTFAQLRQQTLANCCRLKMDALMGRLEHCAEAYFVRCIRPNDSAGGEKHFDRPAVLRQMRQLDLLAVVEQCLAGFSAKFEFANFVSRYRILVPNFSAFQKCHCVQETRAICQQIFEANGFNGPPVAFGKTKIFLKAEGHLMFEQLRKERLQRCAVLVQKYLRGWAQFRQFERLRWAAIVFQKNWRTFAQQRNYQKLINGFTRLQSLVRAHHSVLRFRQLHTNIVQLQAHCRAVLLRHQLYSQRTREDRRREMNFRLEEGQKVAAEPPALFLHAVEFEAGRDCVKNLCGGICVRFDGPMLAQLEGKSWSVDVELANFGWEKFMLAYFQNFSMFHNNCRRPILRALLAQKYEMDEICATAIWCRVQELMGNAFGQKKTKLKSKDKVPIMLRLSAMFGKNYSSAALKQLKYAVLQYSNSIMEDGVPSLHDNILICCGEESALDKIQLIVGIGILRAKLRDEIFCQICTQIGQNPSERSKARGWTLLTLCAACFSPSAQLWPYLLNFVLRFAPTRHIFCRIERSLTRIRRFGARKEPPIEAELFSSIFGDSQMFVPIQLADGRVIPLQIDSQSTAFELCALLSKQIGLDDSFGFGLFLSVGQHFVRPLGVGAECVIDAISSLEAKSERNWRIIFKKELFRAHESDCADAVAIDLAYRQIVHGIHSMEYPCEKEEDLVTLTAQQHFIDIHGNCEVDVKFLEEQLEEMLPIGTLNKKENDEENIEIERQRWVQLIMHTFRKKVVKDGIAPSVEFVKCQVIEFARIHWPIIFSRFFHLNKFSGPHLPCNQISLAVNSDGLIMFDPPRQNQFAEFAFAQISAVSHSHSKRAGAQSISVQLLNGDRFTFQSPRSPELALLINQILHQLRLKSLYAVALQNSSAENAFEYARGDLLILNMPFGEQTPNDWITVENAHIGMHGKIALNAVHILTTAVMPTAEELGSLLTPSSHEVEEAFLSTEPTENGIVPFHSAITRLYDEYSSAAFWTFHFDFGQRMRHPPPHNLEKFAADNFRKAELFKAFAGKSEDSSIYSFSGSVEGHSDLWRHSPKPLKAPLLKRLNAGGRDEIVQQSICSYSHILMYMFDQQPMLAPASPQHSPLEHTDAIFEAPLKHEILRDETYCQLMKQLTLNPNAISEERGWELMWLCLGLFSPSAGLLSELSLFLRSRPYPMAVDCAGRLEKTIGNVRPFSFRQCPPHQVEVEAIQHRHTQIFHKIHLPNGSHANVEVESWSVAKELCERIASTIGLHSAFGLFLFVKVGEKVVCIPPEEHFFDFIHQLQKWARKTLLRQNGDAQNEQFAYKVHFMRKVWLDVVPGQDLRQDLIFHYYQELPKYLRGYHAIGKKDAAQIGALILRAQTKDGKQPPLTHIQHILHQLIPKDFLKAHSSAEWKRQISTEFADTEMPKSPADAKMAFLRRISLEPTFGSAFFEVKQSADPKMGSKLLVAINRDGMSLYALESKQHICTYGFEQICQWQPANTYFHITMDKGNRLLFETTLGHKMDDLLTTYIQALIARRDNGTKCHNINAKSENGTYTPPLLAIGLGHREFA